MTHQQLRHVTRVKPHSTNLPRDAAPNESLPHFQVYPHEWKLVSVRGDYPSAAQQFYDGPATAANYWRNYVTKNQLYNSDCECFAVLMLNTAFRIIGHNLTAIGTLDCVLTHAREVFRASIVAAAHSIVLMHNHPSGDPTPSYADIRITNTLKQAGDILEIAVRDHVIIGHPNYASLRQLKHFI